MVKRDKIGNSAKRTSVYLAERKEKRRKKTTARKNRKRDREELGDAAPPVKKQETLDTKREFDPTFVEKKDSEITNDEACDEFSPFFSGDRQPKTVITSNQKPSKRVYDLIRDLLGVFPNSFFYNRKQFEIKDMVKAANKRDFTSILVIHEDRKKINSLLHICLPNGPTAHYKLSSLELINEIPHRGRASKEKPEIILNNFNTRLGIRIGRMMSTLFPQDANFRARQVCTMHNQRDFIFFRRHRYIIDNPFQDSEKAQLQELGPRFTLKLKSLQVGTFDTKFGEYEWIHKKEMDTSRRRFFL
uniref:Brix-domain-containing protein n=1 Tax=Hirondellea gigas TaxID=1518452 RepID=A0A6A7GD55_9CRUS